MPQLTIPFIAPEIEYVITTSTTGPFVVPFSFFDEEDVKASYVDSNGDLQDLVWTTDFTFNLLNAQDDGYDDGEITLNVALENTTLKIYRSTIIDRLTNWPGTGAFDIELLNRDLNKIVHILQELEELKGTYLHLPENATTDVPFDADGKAICNVGESDDLDCLATNRQVDASGPNWLDDNDVEAAVGVEGQWNTVWTASSVVIQGNDTTKLFDLMTQFFSFVQNRGGSEASFYVRYRYQVDCYSQVSKATNPSYLIKVPPTSAIPFSFMDIEQDIDYLNGNGTLIVGIDFYPVGAASADLWLQWANISVNTSEPR